MLKITGDGSYQNTLINRDGEDIKDYHSCVIKFNQENCTATFFSSSEDEGEECFIDEINIGGLYRLVGDGTYIGTNLFYNDIEVRGIQALTVLIERGVFGKSNHTMLYFSSVFLPNIVEIDEGEENG